MKCINCGNENNEDAKYCDKCGNNLREQVDELVIKTKAIKYDHARENKFLFIIISIVILIVFFIFMVVILFKNPNLNVTINDTDTTQVSQEAIDNEQINQNTDDSNTIVNNNKVSNQIRKLNVTDQSCTSILYDSFNKDYSPYKVLDGERSTVWAEGVSGEGYGESITLYLGSAYNVKQLKIVNGLVNSSDGYNKNNRVASLILSFSDGSSQVVYLDDQVTGYQTINFITPVQTSYVTLTIDDVYHGYKYNDTCIAEVDIFGY